MSNILVKEYESEGFQQLLADFLCSAGSEFKKKRADNAPFPYHYEKLFEREDIRYIVQLTALNDNAIDYPLPIICGILSIPSLNPSTKSKADYVFHILDRDPRINKFEIDIFSPHVIEQYAVRSHRLDGDILLSKALHFDNQLEEDSQNILFIRNFFARNTINWITSKKEVYSSKEGSEENNDRKAWPVILWPDGLTFSETFNEDNENYCLVNLHKTFLPYTGNPACHLITKDVKETFLNLNQTEAIASDYAYLADCACKIFPEQYNDGQRFIKRSERAINNALKVCKYSDTLYKLCQHFINDVSIGILSTKEEREAFNEEYKSLKRYRLKDIEQAKEIVAEHKHLTKINPGNVKEVFYAFLCVNSCLWWHIQKCFELNEKIASTAVPKSLLFRMQMMAVLKEMAELYKLLNDFFPEQESDKSMKLS
ncbi:MAG: hypothetical protein K6E73_08595 [Bacteroidales bacterium]|nr:hypothetical protein [Bacteroidales bacterium]